MLQGRCALAAGVQTVPQVSVGDAVSVSDCLVIIDAQTRGSEVACAAAPYAVVARLSKHHLLPLLDNVGGQAVFAPCMLEVVVLRSARHVSTVCVFISCALCSATNLVHHEDTIEPYAKVSAGNRSFKTKLGEQQQIVAFA